MKLKLTSKLSDDLESILYLDELSETSIWIPKDEFNKYIKRKYLMSQKAYFDTVMHKRGLTNFDECICGNKLKWINIHSGYTETCSPKCRNILTSKGKSGFMVVSKRFNLTNKINQEFLTKYFLSDSSKLDLSKCDTLINLISHLTEIGGKWIAGYNESNIMYANPEVKNHKLNINYDS